MPGPSQPAGRSAVGIDFSCGRRNKCGVVYQEKLSKRMLAAVPPLRWLYDRYTYWKSARRHFSKFVGKGHGEIFSEIYRSNQWGASESVSGLGSELSATERVREELPKIVREFGVRSMLDIPCGDFHWMRQVDLSG